MKKVIITGGEVYNYWTILKEVETVKKVRYVLCKCKCGTEKIVKLQSLIQGKSTKCRHCVKPNLSHGATGTRLHSIWMGIINRCSFNPSYKHLTRCKEWDSFEVFKEWSIKNNYNDNLTIDRIDGTKGYSPDNCRWVTPQIQAENTKIKSTNTSGYRGVTFRKSTGKWRACITVHRKFIEIKCNCNTAQEAALLYDQYVLDNNLTNRPLNILSR